MLWLVVSLIVVVTLWMVKYNNHPIPGPFNFPFSGSALSMLLMDPGMTTRPYQVMHRLANKYGPVMRVMLGNDEYIVLSGYAEIQQFTSKDESTFHMDSKNLDELYAFGKALGVIISDGALWKEQRKFVSQSLRQLSGSHGQGMESRVVEEATQVMIHLDSLLSQGNNIISMDNFFDLPCLNVMWGLVSSKRFDYNDQDLKRMIELIDTFSMNPLTGILVGVPYLKWIPPFRWEYQRIHQSMTQFKQRMQKLVAECRDTQQDDEVRGYIDLFLTEKTNNLEGEYRDHYTDQQLVVTLIDFFTGGSGTMSKTLSFAILYCLSTPRVLSKVEEELSTIQGEVRLSDRAQLPYIQAVLMESSRLGSVLPIPPVRKTSGPMQIGNHMLSAGSLVQVNLYSLLRNQEHWEDPEIFRPERFLKNGRLIQDQWFLPFSTGRRKCIGESIARDTIFLMLCLVLQQFSLHPSPSHPLPSLHPVGGLTIGPQPFQARVARRT